MAGASSVFGIGGLAWGLPNPPCLRDQWGFSGPARLRKQSWKQPAKKAAATAPGEVKTPAVKVKTTPVKVKVLSGPRLAKYQEEQSKARRSSKPRDEPSEEVAASRPPKRPRTAGGQQAQEERPPAGPEGKAQAAASQLREAAAKAARAAVWVAGAAKEAIQAAQVLAAATHEAMPLLLVERKMAEEAARAVEELAKTLIGTSSSGMELTIQAQDAMVRAAYLEDQRAGPPPGAPSSLQSSSSGRAEALGLEGATAAVGSGASPRSSAEQGAISAKDQGALMLGASRRVPPPSAATPQKLASPAIAPAPKRHPIKHLNKMTGCQLAEWRSQMSLAQASRQGRKIRDSDVTFVLDAWKFRKNDRRRNVIPDGKGFVNSEMLGLITIRAYRKLCIAKQSVKYPMVTKLLCQYVYDNPPAGLQKGEQFPFSTVCINKDYAAKRHRDNNNVGLSIVRALGDFKGGRLKYWPEDPGPRAAPDPNLLDEGQAVTLDVRGRSVALDSTKAHEVEDFEGRRYSIVYFTIPWIDQADKAVRSALFEQCGLEIRDLSKCDALWSKVKHA